MVRTDLVELVRLQIYLQQMQDSVESIKVESIIGGL